MKRLLILCLIFFNAIYFIQCESDKEVDALTKADVRSNYDTILNYFSLRQKKIFHKTYKRLFVLTENGCVSCNKNFLGLIKNNLTDLNSAFLLGTTGAYLNVSGLDSFKNVFIDQSILETDYTMFHKSKVIFFTEKGIDTIINISAIDIQKQFNIINNRE